MPPRRKKKLRKFLTEIYAKQPDWTTSTLDLKNYIIYGDRAKDVVLAQLLGAPHRMLNIRSLTSSIPLDSDGCWDDVFEYAFGDPNGVGWERFGVGYFDPDQDFGASRGYQGAIYIPPGEYCIKRRAINMTGHHVYGQGWLTTNNRTTIKIHDNATASFTQVAYCSNGSTTVSGIMFDANHKARYGFRAYKASTIYSHFENIRGVNAKWHGVLFEGCQGATMHRIQGGTSATSGSGSGVVFNSCNASRATNIEAVSPYNEWGIQVLGGSATDLGFSGGMYLNGRVENAISGAILVDRVTTPSKIYDTWIEAINGHGVKVINSRGNVLENLRITVQNTTDTSIVPEGQSRVVYHSGAVACSVRNVGVEGEGSGDLACESMERTAASEVSYTDNYKLWGSAFGNEGFGEVTVISSSS